MGLSAYARLLFIGLWNEAYDDGVFDWKPLTIKARLFPVDGVDVQSLLAELVAAGCVQEREKYGLIRNFRKFQRPKKPNSSGLLLPEDHEYVGLVPNQFPTGTEKAPQMEDGGWRREDGKESPPTPNGGEAGALFDEMEEGFPRSPHYTPAKAKHARAVFYRLSADGQRLAHAAAIDFGNRWGEDQRKRGRSVEESLQFAPLLGKWLVEGSWQTFDATQPAVIADNTLDWPARIKAYEEHDVWPNRWGPKPGEPGCKARLPIDQDDPLRPIIERAGHPFIVGKLGRAWLPLEVIEQARAKMAGAA